MGTEKYGRSIRLICSTCAGSDFEYDHEAGPIRCKSCDRVFTRDELIAENGELIEAEIEEAKSEIVNDLKKDFREQLRRSFSGSKHVRIR